MLNVSKIKLSETFGKRSPCTYNVSEIFFFSVTLLHYLFHVLGIYLNTLNVNNPHRLTGDFGSSVFAVTLFCLSKVTWTYSVHAEVFSLNNLMVAVIMYVAVLFEKTLKQNDDNDGEAKRRRLRKVGLEYVQ